MVLRRPAVRERPSNPDASLSINFLSASAAVKEQTSGAGRSFFSPMSSRMPYCRRNGLGTIALFWRPEPSNRWRRKLICINVWYAVRAYCFQRQPLTAGGAVFGQTIGRRCPGLPVRPTGARAGGSCNRTRSRAPQEDAHETAWRYRQAADASNRQPRKLPAEKTGACSGVCRSEHRRTARQNGGNTDTNAG